MRFGNLLAVLVVCHLLPTVASALITVGSIETPGSERGVEVVGELAHVADYDSGLRVIDVSNPAFPVAVGALARGSRLWREADVDVVSSLAYMVDFELGLRIIEFGPEYAPAIPIDLDINSGGDPIAVNPASGGAVPVAVLGSDSFDVRDVDATTLAFGPAGATPAHRGGGHFADVNGDGHLDLLSHYRVGETGLDPGDREGCVTGETLDGRPLEGCDTIEVSAPPSGRR